jgi:DNA-binding MarR family transcriptional regulator
VQAKVVSAQALSEVIAPVWALLYRRSSADLFRVIGDLNTSFSQVKMLFLLEDGREHSVKEIAEKLSLSVPAASRAIDGMIDRGYVSRRESEEDRRSRLIKLTPEGQVIVKQVLEARLQTLRAFAEDLLPEERDRLHAALLPIVERIAPR